MMVCTCAQLSAAPWPRSFKGSIISVNRLHTPMWCVLQPLWGLPERGLPLNCIWLTSITVAACFRSSADSLTLLPPLPAPVALGPDLFLLLPLEPRWAGILRCWASCMKPRLQLPEICGSPRRDVQPPHASCMGPDVAAMGVQCTQQGAAMTWHRTLLAHRQAVGA